MVRLRRGVVKGGRGEGPVLRDYILAALYLAGGKLSKLRLHKLLQVVAHYSPRLRSLADFDAHRFGAWSADVASELEWLSEEGAVRTGEGVELLAVGEGARSAERIGRDAELMREVLRIFRELDDDDELLVFMYTVFGGHERSEKKRLLENRELRLRTALKLYSKGLVSLTLAARIAGLDVVRFAEIARKELGGLPVEEKLLE